MKNPSVNDLITIEIEKITSSGRGLGRTHGAVVFVPMSAVGDQLQIKIVKAKKNYYEGEIIKVLRPSVDRVEPKCQHYAHCGGCNLQHINQEGQLKAKETILLDALQSLFIKKIKDPSLKNLIEREISVSPIRSNPQFWNYRNRIQPIFKNNKFHFARRNSNDLEPIEQCHIIEEPIQKFIEQKFHKLSEGRTELRLNEKLQVEAFAMMNEPEGYGFSQVNRFQNQELIDYVLNHTIESSVIYDLYAGSGNFTFPLAKKFKKTRIVAVELSEKLYRLGVLRTNEWIDSEKTIEFKNIDVEKFLELSPLAKNSSVLLDPPRIGCSTKVMKALAASQLRQIIYISCNPSALARDLSIFYDSLPGDEANQWKIKNITPFEMFSHSDHLETIVQLVHT